MAVRSTENVGTYLKNLRRASSSARAGESVNPFGLLVALLDNGPQTLSGLMSETSMGFSDFVESLRIVVDAELVTILDSDGDDLIALTDKGEKVAQLTR